MPKLVRFNLPFFQDGEPKYLAGKHYPITEETLRCAAAGTAEVVEIDIAVEEAQKLADKAKKAAEIAATKAVDAQQALEAAKAAQEEADRAQQVIAAAADEEAKVRKAEDDAAAAREKQEAAKKLLDEELARQAVAAAAKPAEGVAPIVAAVNAAQTAAADANAASDSRTN